MKTHWRWATQRVSSKDVAKGHELENWAERALVITDKGPGSGGTQNEGRGERVGRGRKPRNGIKGR